MLKQFFSKQFSLAHKNISISKNSVQHKYSAETSKQFYVKQFSLT